MAHMIENNEMAFIGNRKDIWHGLGHAVSNGISVKEMQKICGADYSVTKEPEYIRIGGKEIKTGKYSLVRSDKPELSGILSTVSSDWKPVQNDVAFEFFHDFVEEGNMSMNTAGVLDSGRMVWVLAKVKEGFSLFNGKDNVESYLLFSNPHQYGKSTTVMATPIRVVCWNTLQLALAGKSDMMIRLNHRREFDPEMVKKTLHLNKQRLETYKEAAEFLSTKKYDEENLMEYFDKIFPLTSNKKGADFSRNANLLWEIVDTQPGAKYGEGTWWQAFNAVTYATDHLIGNTDETRLYSAFYGRGRERKIDALKLATEYAKSA